MVDYVKLKEEDEPPSYEQEADPPQQVYPPVQGQPGQGYVHQQYPQPQVVVVQQGYQGFPPSQGFPPQTHTTLAWIACLCFFWPVGLVAVVKAHEAEQCVGRGDYEGGKRSGEAANKWAIAAIITQLVLGVVVGIIYFTIGFFGL
ncbi:synapse differentiation-inducing gene protein 1-like isoform X2 [Bolinopsis microptera]|uniref:synapse differentiation-inducing gene protein 1-like isoform X2 n=1 Tax=Bolinopsis microptera TaxID=2820187 RepID=UPI00307AD08C